MSARVLLLGGTGFVGAAVRARLVADGFEVNALSRRGGEGLLAGDATQVEVLTKALEGCSAVCVCVPWQKEVEVAAALIDAAKRLNRKDLHVVHLSGISVIPQNAGTPMVDAKLEAERQFSLSGLPCTTLKPSWFMDALALFVRDGRATLFGPQPVSWNMVCLSDFAAVVSRVVASPPRTQTLVIEGPQALRFGEALAQYCQVKHAGLEPSTLPLWLGRVLAFFTRSQELGDFVALMAFFSRVSRLAAPNLVCPTTFDDWLGAPPLLLRKEGHGRTSLA